MRYYWLCPRGQRRNTWIFFEEHARGVTLRKKYKQFQCSGCGKINEDEALRLPVGDVRVNAKADFLVTDDGVPCVSDRFIEVAEAAGLSGLAFKRLPASGYSLALPVVFAKTDFERAGFQVEQPKCSVCGRYRGVYVGPMLASMGVPTNPLEIFSSDIANENQRGRVTRLFASDDAVHVLRKASVSGVFFDAMGEK